MRRGKAASDKIFRGLRGAVGQFNRGCTEFE